MAAVALLLLGSAALSQAASAWPKLQEVIVVSKTHFDIGYTDLASKVVDRYRTGRSSPEMNLVLFFCCWLLTVFSAPLPSAPWR